MAPEDCHYDYTGSPSLVLAPPPGNAVRHLLLAIDPKQAAAVRRALAALEPGFHGQSDMRRGMLSVGISAAGLEALGVPRPYRRVFQRLAPAFHLGAPRRSGRLGDVAASAVSQWDAAFAQSHAHLLLSWHGCVHWVEAQVQALLAQWPCSDPRDACYAGERIGAPPGESGEWVHFGYRDGISEVQLHGLPSAALDPRPHAPGAMLLGAVDDLGVNRFALAGASAKVRRFFQGGSFGVFRPMAQDVAAFEQQLGDWLRSSHEPIDWIKAKLCGRWPNGRVIAGASRDPNAADYDLGKALKTDSEGLGCPFGSHVRRMRPPERDDGLDLPRPLQRRSLPYGPPLWNPGGAAEAQSRGLLGHFFCASIEQQFEHLLGQWAARPPLNLHPADSAGDPLTGPQAPDAALLIPRDQQPTLSLRGLSAWTRTRGTLYAWYPHAQAWQALLTEDYVADEDLEPWV